MVQIAEYIIRKQITLTGIVVGAGLRSFVYNLAIKYGLAGWVKHTKQGTVIDIEGKNEDIDELINQLKRKPPRLVQVSGMEIKEMSVAHYKEFKILSNDDLKEAAILVPPDSGVCEACIKEINDPKNRRYQYAFNSCGHCGSRFSMIKKLPYDRASTSMKDLKMCDDCKKEYNDSSNRRYQAQNISCPKCGPKLEITNYEGKKLKCESPLKLAIQFLKEGKIGVVKGLTGFHMMCKSDEETIEKLRSRKRHQSSPLSLMMKDIKTVKKYFKISEAETKILTGFKRPILLLNQKRKNLPGNIIPKGNKTGVMLPQLPLHYLLFDDELEVLVVTSANKSQQPISYKNKDVINQLKGKADFFLLHNQDIVLPADDSVSRYFMKEERVIKGGRGMVPYFGNNGKDASILACGSFYENTFSLYHNERILYSPYLGNVKSSDSVKRFKTVLTHYKKLYNINPTAVAFDRVPNNLPPSNENIISYKIQHHHAHIVSCMFENNIKDNVIGVAFDTMGYGTDNHIWGSEFLICNERTFFRAGCFNEIKLIEKEMVSYEPWKIATCYLNNAFPKNIENYITQDLKDKEIINLTKKLSEEVNIPIGSSMGRLFDAVAALLGYKEKVTYQAETAIWLECNAIGIERSRYNYEITYENCLFVVQTAEIFKGILYDLKNGVNKNNISGKFHNTIIDITVNMCMIINGEFNINRVVLSGNFFQNEILLKGIYNQLVLKRFSVFIHKRIPCNDSGLSIGQIAIAHANIIES